MLHAFFSRHSILYGICALFVFEFARYQCSMFVQSEICTRLRYTKALDKIKAYVINMMFCQMKIQSAGFLQESLLRFSFAALVSVIE